MNAIVAAGLGCRKGCPGEEIVALVRETMAKAGLAIDTLSGLFAPAFKHGETGLGAAAQSLGVPLVLIPEPLMKAAEPRAVTVSERVVDPLALVAKGSVWYLVAAVEGEPRTYRVSRIQSATVLDEPCVRPAGFDIAAYWERAPTEFQATIPRFE